MISLEINSEYRDRIPADYLIEKIGMIFRNLNLEPSPDLSVLIGSDIQLKKMNRKYRGINTPTDVLSFESMSINPETGNEHLGDIAISYEAAERQANEAGHACINEIILLITHAILHLVGFDHETSMEKTIMWKKQYEILDSIQIKILRISGDDQFHD